MLVRTHHHLVHKRLDILLQSDLLAFQGQDMVDIAIENLLGDVPLAAHGVRWRQWRH